MALGRIPLDFWHGITSSQLDDSDKLTEILWFIKGHKNIPTTFIWGYGTWPTFTVDWLIDWQVLFVTCAFFCYIPATLCYFMICSSKHTIIFHYTIYFSMLHRFHPFWEKNAVPILSSISSFRWLLKNH